MKRSDSRRLTIQVLESRVALAADTLTLEPFSLGFSRPLVLTHANDQSGRVFVVEQSGSIHMIDAEGNREATPFLDISERVDFGGERGLLGLAFHPDYAMTGAEGEGQFYVHYSASSRMGDHQSTVSQFEVARTDPDRADPNSELVLMTFNQPFSNHNGGDLAFGPDDGMLYISSGDGGGAGDPLDHAQNGNTLLGGIMRIDVNRDGFPDDGLRNYSIPNDNPFVNDPTVSDEWFATGMRNPYRMSFDDGPSGKASPDRLFSGDVGQSAFEEINLVEPGENYGWNTCEGDHVFRDVSRACPGVFAPPIAEYGRDEGVSVIGGYVYRGERFPSMRGTYVFGDFDGSIMTLDQNPNGSFTRGVPMMEGASLSTISGFGQDQAGELYVLTFAGIYSIRGQAGAELNFDLASTITISRNNSELIVTELLGGQEVERYRERLDSFGLLRINGSAGDDRLVLDTINPEVISKIDWNASTGVDSIGVSAAIGSLPLSSIKGLLDSVERVDLVDSAVSSIRVESSDLADRTNDEVLRIVYGGADVLDLSGHWETLDPVVEPLGNRVPIQRRLINRVESNTRQLHLQSASPFANPSNVHDVNRDQVTSAFDALLIVNAITDRDGILHVPDRLNQPFRYYDVSGDNQLTARDALLIINELARETARGSQAEGAAREGSRVFDEDLAQDAWLGLLF